MTVPDSFPKSKFPLHLRNIWDYFQTWFMCIHKSNQLVTYLRESYNRLWINIIVTSLTLQLML